MPTPTKNFARITLKGRFQGVNTENVFHYWNIDETANPAYNGLGLQFDLVVAQAISTIASDQQTYDEILVSDVLGLVADAIITPTIPTGVVNGETNGPFNAFSYTLVPSNKETRKGFKRFSGVPEISNDGGVLTAGYISALQAIESAFTTPLTSGGGDWTPVIYGGPTPSDPLRLVANPIISAISSAAVTTQANRKFT